LCEAFCYTLQERNGITSDVSSCRQKWHFLVFIFLSVYLHFSFLLWQ